MQKLIFSPYQAADRAACLDLFKSNIKTYMADEEIVDYQQFLDELTSGSPRFADCHYYVGRLDGKIVAAGGWDKHPDGCYLRWGIVSSEHHKHGLGSQLLKKRLGAINKAYPKTDVRLITSQMAQGFFQRWGFTVVKVIPEGISQGIDEVHMLLSSNEKLTGEIAF